MPPAQSGGKGSGWTCADEGGRGGGVGNDGRGGLLGGVATDGDHGAEERRESLNEATTTGSPVGSYLPVDATATDFEESWSCSSFRIVDDLKPASHRSQPVLPAVIDRFRPVGTGGVGPALGAGVGPPSRDGASAGDGGGYGASSEGELVVDSSRQGARNLPQRQPDAAPATGLLQGGSGPSEAGWGSSFRKAIRGVGGSAVVPIEEETPG